MGKKSKALTVFEPVEPLIRDIRGERVILDVDLARIYRVLEGRRLIGFPPEKSKEGKQSK